MHEHGRFHESSNIDELLARLEELPIAAHSSAITTAQAKFTERLLREQNGNGKPPAQEPERFLEAEEAAQRCGFSTDWLYSQARADKLPFAIRFGRAWRFSKLGLEDWLKRRSRNGR